MKGLKKVLYLAGAMLLAGNAYSQTGSVEPLDSTPVSNKVISGNQVIETYEMKTEIKEANINYRNLSINPKDEVKNFSKYTPEDQEECVKELAKYLVADREMYEKQLIDCQKVAGQVPELKESNKTLETKLDKKTKELREFRSGEDPGKSSKGKKSESK